MEQHSIPHQHSEGFTLDNLRAGSIKVIVGTASSAVLGAVSGSTIGVLRNQPAMPMAFTAGLNTGLFSFTFFSFREYLVHPAFTFLPPSLQREHLDRSSSPHTVHLLSTALAALPAGSIFSIVARGSRGALKAGLTLSLGCTSLQSIFNEGALLRLKLLVWAEDRRAAQDALDSPSNAEPSQVPPTYTRDISSPTPSVPSRETFSERSDRLIGEAWGWGKRSLQGLSPVKKIDQGVYESMLREKLDGVRQERERIHEEIGALENKKDNEG